MSAVGSRVTGIEVGAVLAFLASRVLGQYELFLPPDPTGQAPTGRLTLVAPNIVNTEQELNVNPRDFRLWVCLHEETHRVQFTGVPWLREYVSSQTTDFLLASDIDLPALLERLRSAAGTFTDVVRGGEGNLIDAIQTPEQKVILDRLTAVMTLVEGTATTSWTRSAPRWSPRSPTSAPSSTTAARAVPVSTARSAGCSASTSR